MDACLYISIFSHTFRICILSPSPSRQYEPSHDTKYQQTSHTHPDSYPDLSGSIHLCLRRRPTRHRFGRARPSKPLPLPPSPSLWACRPVSNLSVSCAPAAHEESCWWPRPPPLNVAGGMAPLQTTMPYTVVLTVRTHFCRLQLVDGAGHGPLAVADGRLVRRGRELGREAVLGPRPCCCRRSCAGRAPRCPGEQKPLPFKGAQPAELDSTAGAPGGARGSVRGLIHEKARAVLVRQA